MKTINHRLSLGFNFTPFLVEKILSEFVEECANRDHDELSPYVISLISRGLPDDEDKQELLAIFKKIIHETGEINSTDTDIFCFDVILNNEYNITLKFMRNYAPFMGGAWQRA